MSSHMALSTSIADKVSFTLLTAFYYPTLSIGSASFSVILASNFTFLISTFCVVLKGSDY